ncbi:MAG: penicillin-binding protein 1A [Xanthobacteraceae bacterium]|nr:penicillin-binding protein 1A [Xanthobacteraceae bacterium]MBX3534072.1 penicillin-binding protein 1A [Xanthobacteraceae bacterium]MBX3548805.1 penicillin-binding protein 1A [Xanthobacteraceae bacterium]MCW5674435.1 penicillin-binding protein 1A [Xanthobacteraceae bacterium]MCW5678753.1 penicillin-binding protein 1A [Xanthobacteraceae bacterium]
MRFFVRFLGFLFAAGAICFVVGAVGLTWAVWHYSKDLPDFSQLQDYEPPVMTRVHASDGSLVAEYAKERRLYLPIQAIPKRVFDAFTAAEDKNFWEHGGIDLFGIARAVVNNIEQYGTGRRPQGASTITQQVAKNFLTGNETSLNRKIKEALLALRIERAYSKEKILELYLNEIYLGLGAYGIAAASLLYFDKSVHQLSIEEVAYLAALPKGPNNYHPFRQRDAALSRRNWVIDQMVVTGAITQQEANEAKKKPLNIAMRAQGPNQFNAEYFAEEVRREIFERYGEDKLYKGGLSVRTTLNPKLQVIARRVFTAGLVRFDESRGWRGAQQKMEPTPGSDWGAKLAEIRALSDTGWRLAVVLQVTDNSATIGFQPARDRAGQLSPERQTGVIPAEGVKWTKKGMRHVFAPGDVIYVSKLEGKENQWRLQQVPDVSGGMIVMDPWTGRVLALVGGFSFDESQFNRVTQAYRQPGSSFKPFVYAAALDNGYTPSSIVMDAPFELEQGPNQQAWRPENYSGKFYGPQTLRFGIENSRNVMTVRLAQDIGMPLVQEYARRFGIYDNMPPYLSYALGAGETTLLRMAAGYSMFANGGRKVKATLIDRIQDRYGKTIYKHDDRQCQGCEATKWENQNEPTLIDRRELVIDPMSAYQITSMMEGVVLRGTGTALRPLNRPVAGKTGTTNDEKDVWFMGFTPDMVVGVYLGYDRPKPLGRGATGGTTAAPIVRDFLKEALADRPPQPFRVPPGLKLIRVDLTTGLRAQSGDSKVILEAFRPGTAPPDNLSIVGFNDENGNPIGGNTNRGTSQDQQGFFTRGRGLW